MAFALVAACGGRNDAALLSAQANQDEGVWITLPRRQLMDAWSALGLPPDVQGLTAAHSQRVSFHRLGERERSGDEIVAIQVSEEQTSRLGEFLHEATGRCGGFMAHASADASVRALSLLEPRFEKAQYTLDQPKLVEALSDALSQSHVLDVIAALSNFPTRHHATRSGHEAAEWLREHWSELARGRDDVEVTLFKHSMTQQPSVVMTVRGATVPDEVVVLGAHLDSISGRGPSSAAPGADDDASGVAALSDVARAIFRSNYRPARTVAFMAYAAEEVGLRGSAEIAAKYNADGVNVIGALQLDMIGFAGSGRTIAFIEDRTDRSLTTFGKALVDAYVKVPWISTQCGYACSDHASWNGQGFATVFPFESSLETYNRNLHSPADTIAGFGGNADHAMLFVEFAAAFTAELAKGQILEVPAQTPGGHIVDPESEQGVDGGSASAGSSDGSARDEGGSVGGGGCRMGPASSRAGSASTWILAVAGALYISRRKMRALSKPSAAPGHT